MASSPITSWQIDREKNGNSDRFYFLGLQNHDGWWLQPWNQKMLAHWKKSYKNLDSILKSRDITADKCLCSESYDFSSSHVWMWKLDHKEGWMPKSWCFWTVVLENTLESPLDYREIKPVNSKDNWPWIFIGRTNAEAKAPVLWPPDAKDLLTGKDPDAGKDWGQEEKGW